MIPNSNVCRFTVCVAIPTYNREQVLIDTIAQVLAQEPLADEVLVIDQTAAHEPETEAFLRQHADVGNIRWVKQSPPNLPGARNRALAETKCDVLIFIDDDVELPEDFVEKHRRNYAEPQVVAVAGRIVQPGLSVQARKKWPPIMDHRFFSLGSTDRKEGIASFRGCNHSLRVCSVIEIGGYDTNYIGWAWGEEADVAIRLWKTGGTIVFDPDASLKHLTLPTGGCRLIKNNKSVPEWQISFPPTYFAIRHLFPNRWFWYGLFVGNVRCSIFRKDNVFHPWRLPWAVLSYGYSFLLATWLCMRGSKISAQSPVTWKTDFKSEVADD